MKKKIESKIKTIIAKSLKIKKINIRPTLKSSNCKNWDSLNFLTLVSNLEKGLKTKFNYKEMIMLDSYKNIIKVIDRKFKNE